MPAIKEDRYQEHMAPIVAEGFALDPPGWDRLSQWTHMLMHITNARANSQR